MKHAALVLLCISLFECNAAARREAAVLVAAVDDFRRAESPAKENEAQRVAAVACTDDKVCDAKRTCLSAIEPTARALTLKGEVERSVASIESKTLAPDSAEAVSLPVKLDEAEELLSDGRSKMSDCDRKLAELQLQLGM